MPRVAVCSWSLLPSDPFDLARKARACGVDAVQLALGPIVDGAWRFEVTVVALARAGVDVVSGMLDMVGEDYTTIESIRRTGGVRPDETWPRNLERAHEAARLARRLSIELVTFHAGFVPEERDDPTRRAMVERLVEIADVMGKERVRVGLETGQESPSCLLGLLEEIDRENVGVNFDPANLLLYGTGDPIDSLRRLVPTVEQIHVKDARRPTTAGVWGEECPVGEGEVDWDRFFDLVASELPDVDLVIEREAGDDRVGDVRRAVCFVRGALEERRA